MFIITCFVSSSLSLSSSSSSLWSSLSKCSISESDRWSSDNYAFTLQQFLVTLTVQDLQYCSTELGWGLQSVWRKPLTQNPSVDVTLPTATPIWPVFDTFLQSTVDESNVIPCDFWIVIEHASFNGYWVRFAKMLLSFGSYVLNKYFDIWTVFKEFWIVVYKYFSSYNIGSFANFPINKFFSQIHKEHNWTSNFQS